MTRVCPGYGLDHTAQWSAAPVERQGDGTPRRGSDGTSIAHTGQETVDRPNSSGWLAT